MLTNTGVTLAVAAVYSPAAMAIHYEQLDGHVARITIDRPEARNSLDLLPLPRPGGGVAALPRRPGRLGGDRHRRRGQLHDRAPTSRPTSRRSPRSQKQISSGEVDEIDGCRLRDGTDAVLRSLKIYKPIIAAVDGPCVAGGMEMLGGVDIRLATERATFGVMEPKRGLFAGGGTTVRLPRQISYPAAMEFLLTAEAFPASRAMELGLLNEIVPQEELADRALEWARPHHRERAAGRAGHQGERAAGPRRRPARGVQDRGRAGRQDLLERGRQGGPEGVRREAPAPVDGHVTPSTRARRA